jgi:transcriptional regulator with GAF, ATPase, and Fis domain
MIMSEKIQNSVLDLEPYRNRESTPLDLTGKFESRHRFEVTDATLADWQKIVDLITELVDVPLALITRADEHEIEIVSVNERIKSDFPPGNSRPYTDDYCSYCEAVIRRRQALTVLNGAREPGWQTSPELANGMVSYLGFPLDLPDGTPFGTLCVMDRVQHQFSDAVVNLMTHFKSMVEGHLALLFVNSTLGAQNQSLMEMLKEIETLRGIVPICASCKNVRDDSGFWHSVEAYVSSRTGAKFSHGLCPGCIDEIYPDFT